MKYIKLDHWHVFLFINSKTLFSLIIMTLYLCGVLKLMFLLFARIVKEFGNLYIMPCHRKSKWKVKSSSPVGSML